MEKKDLQSITEGSVYFFATGDEYVRNNLNLEFIPHEHTDKNAPRGIIKQVSSTKRLIFFML